MSGHSKWSKIKRKKGANDAKKGAVFTKMAKAITMAAAEGGGDPDMNFGLRLAIDSAKKENMPLLNIERAVKKGTGESGDGGKIARNIYECVGPSGTSFVIRCSTDNTNRTVSELRRMFEEAGGSMGTSGSQMWLFDEKGVILIKSQKLEKSQKFGHEDQYVDVNIEDLEMELMDVEGIMDMERMEEGEIELTTPKTSFAAVHKKLDEMGIKIEEAEIRFVPKDYINPEEKVIEKVLGLMEKLDDHDDVDSVYTNVDI